MASKKVTRQSSCGLLDIPLDIACHHCVPSITKSIQNGKACKRIKKCTQPWLEKWANHRELEKVRVHKKMVESLGKIDYSPTLIDTCV